MQVVLVGLIIVALIAFLLGIVNPQPPGVRNINWVSAGLAMLTLAYLLSKPM